MRRALALARRGLGKTSPNPAVGAVLVRKGRVVGEGWHQRAGGPHAEVVALKKAGDKRQETEDRRGARRAHTTNGLTLYVTLEPCSTWGRTPPCTDAIVAAGVKRVVVAVRDPNPKHNGRGLKALRGAGIRVEAGLLAEEAAGMNEGFNKWITTGTPLVIAKAGMSLDGKIATRTGDSKWITGEAARREGHRLRAQVDAIVVGTNTVIRDDPELTVRHGVRGQQPWRVVVDARGRVSRRAKVFRDGQRRRTLVLTTSLAPVAWRRNLLRMGVDAIVLPQRDGRVDLRAALKALGRRDITTVLVEGGGELLGSLFDARLVDRVALFYAPIVIGGRGAVAVVAGEGAVTVGKAVRLRDCRWRRVGKDEMLLEASVAQ